MEAPSYFKNKKVTVMGLGLLGRAVGDAEFLAQCGASVLVTDKKDASQLAESVARLQSYATVSFRLGEHREEDFTNADLVLKAAGVPLDSPYIAAARAAGVPVIMSTAFFAKHTPATVVGVTGTRGKSTVTHMIHHVLKQVAPRPSSGRERQVFLGGNVRGVSTLALLPETKEGDIAVLELDSWQLQGFGDLAVSPQVSVFTNLLADHMNYYGDDMDAYFADKANIFRNQKAGDVLVVGAGLKARLTAAKPPVAPTYPPALPSDWQLQIPGEHNRENASLAAEALRALDVPEAVIQSGLESFTGVEGRLQRIGDVNGVAVYNDNNATTPDATIAGVQALDTGAKNIVLLMGGADKGLDMSRLLSEIAQRVKSVVLLDGTGTERVRSELPDAPVCHSMEAAVTAVFDQAQPGDVILFSPAFASFGMFTNEYDRGDQFVAAVDVYAK